MGHLRSNLGKSFQKNPAALFYTTKNPKIIFFTEQEFDKPRVILLFKKKHLVVEEANDNRPHVAKKLSDVEEDLLFRSGQFGD